MKTLLQETPDGRTIIDRPIALVEAVVEAWQGYEAQRDENRSGDNRGPVEVARIALLKNMRALADYQPEPLTADQIIAAIVGRVGGVIDGQEIDPARALIRFEAGRDVIEALEAAGLRGRVGYQVLPPLQGERRKTVMVWGVE